MANYLNWFIEQKSMKGCTLYILRNSKLANCCSPSGGVGRVPEDQLRKLGDNQTGEKDGLYCICPLLSR